MPVKRRLAKGRTHRITPAAVDAFTARDGTALHRALGLRPWQASPLDVDDPAPPTWMTYEDQRADWRAAWELRQDLEAGNAS